MVSCKKIRELEDYREESIDVLLGRPGTTQPSAATDRYANSAVRASLGEGDSAADVLQYNTCRRIDLHWPCDRILSAAGASLNVV